MARSISFIAEGDVDTEITITENADGTLTFDIAVVEGGLIGDLRAVFFDLQGVDASTGTFAVMGSDVTDEGFEEEGVDSLGRDASVKGQVLNEMGAFDAGLEFGTSGMAWDDIQETSFTLFWDGDGDGTSDLTLDMLDMSDFALRYTSVGEEGGSRNASAKIGDQAGTVAQDDAIDICEDEIGSHDLVANDGTAAGLAVTGIRLDGDTGFTALPGGGFTLTDAAGISVEVTLSPDGTAIVDATGAEALEAGETAVFTFDYQTTAADGSTATATVTISVCGEADNTPPTITVSDDSGFVCEDDAPGTLTDSGTILFEDADAGDSHGVTSGFAGSTHGSQLGTLTAVLTAAGEVTWSFEVDAAAVQFLNAGETIIESYEITIDDGNGGSVTETVEVVICGENDVPTVSGDTAGGVDEDGVDAPTTVTGQLSVEDPDAGDTHTWDVTGGGTGTYGTLSVDEDGTWTYTLDNDSGTVQALDDLDEVTETFEVTVTDGSGETATETVTITVTGTTDDTPPDYEGGDTDDVYYGEQGDTVVEGNGGNDYLDGDAEELSVYGSDFGTDAVIFDETGEDFLPFDLYEFGNDTIDGGADNDSVAGDAAVFYAEDFGSGVFVTTGDDSVSGGEGDDYVQGEGVFSDTFAEGFGVVDVTLGSDNVDGGGGTDEATGDAEVMTSTAADGGVAAQTGGDDTVTGGDGSDGVYGDAVSMDAFGNAILGEGGGTGGGLATVAGGNDVVSGGFGDDVVYGDAAYSGAYGDDSGSAPVVAAIVGGDDMVSGGAGNDILFGDFGSATSFGIGSAEIVGGNDTIAGGTGDDEMWGDWEFGGGDGTLLTGADTFVFEADSGLDTIHDFEVGTDTIDVSALGITDFSQLAISYAGGDAVIDFDGTPDDTDEVTLVGVSSLTADDFLYA
ncbi:hypothetical protein HKCCE2091_05715 [Rhodobacterales bacterium HKCCE2091]|nr:hypothetical protein [Rhodobacterales bacterium HKCCE2091]